MHQKYSLFQHVNIIKMCAEISIKILLFFFWYQIFKTQYMFYAQEHVSLGWPRFKRSLGPADLWLLYWPGCSRVLSFAFYLSYDLLL